MHISENDRKVHVGGNFFKKSQFDLFTRKYSNDQGIRWISIFFATKQEI